MPTEKLQYYATDLSYLLDIGEIADMHVVTLDNGAQVLRIEAISKKEDEYKTVKVAPNKKKPAQKKTQVSHKVPAQQRQDNPATLGNKIIGIGAAWMQKKDKPQFMKDAGY